MMSRTEHAKQEGLESEKKAESEGGKREVRADTFPDCLLQATSKHKPLMQENQQHDGHHDM